MDGKDSPAEWERGIQSVLEQKAQEKFTRDEFTIGELVKERDTLRSENAALQRRNKEHEQFRHQHRDCDAVAVENQGLRKSVVDLEMENLSLGLKYRRLLWLTHGHNGLYGDDGEMQCSRCLPFGVCDYKREVLERVEEAAAAAMLNVSTAKPPKGGDSA